jgi:predicted XRE-type DNA-binding protein
MRLTNGDFEIGSGNVFRDLGLSDAEELELKSELALLIARRIRKLGLTQQKAASLIGLDQPKVSALIRGHLEKFSKERLCELLRRLGCDVEIRISGRNGVAPGKMKISAR